MKSRGFVCLALGLVACGGQHKLPSSNHARTSAASSLVIDGKQWASLFQQHAAEYKALCIQAYNLAGTRVQAALSLPASGKPLAVITDIDETLLDNSAYAVQQARNGQDYDQASWENWTSRAEAMPVPGALHFFQFCKDHQVEVFYITNRTVPEKQGTLNNLSRLGFPYADESHLLLKDSISGKEMRRQLVAGTHYIVLLLGDNLSDFSETFDRKTTEERDASVASSAAAFGDRFIILPNFTYGGWEDALNNYDHSLSLPARDSIVKKALNAY